MVDISKFKKLKDRLVLVYPSVPSSVGPVSHNDELPFPTPPQSAKAAAAAAAYPSDVDSTDELGNPEPGAHNVINQALILLRRPYYHPFTLS